MAGNRRATGAVAPGRCGLDGRGERAARGRAAAGDAEAPVAACASSLTPKLFRQRRRVKPAPGHRPRPQAPMGDSAVTKFPVPRAVGDRRGLDRSPRPARLGAQVLPGRPGPRILKVSPGALPPLARSSPERRHSVVAVR